MDGTSTSAWDVRSSCYSERMRRQAEEEDPSREYAAIAPLVHMIHAKDCREIYPKGAL